LQPVDAHLGPQVHQAGISDVTKLNAAWLRRFCIRHSLSPKRKTNKKRIPVTERIPLLKRYFACLRHRLLTENTDDIDFTPQYGLFPPENRFNVDQVPAGLILLTLF
jgi:hypothetical protein